MIDLTLERSIITFYLPLGVIFNMILYFCLMKLGWKSWSQPSRHYKKDTLIVFLFTLLCLCVFSYTGDFYHYFDIFRSFLHGGNPTTHLEDVYASLFNWVFGSYYLWRALIWGVSVILLTWTCRFLRLNSILVWFVFLSYGVIFFVNGRVSLAMSILFFGLSVMVRPKNSFIKRVLGFIIMLSSIFFHKTMGFGIAVAILSLLSNKINKFTIGVCLLLIPLFIILAKLFIMHFLLMSADEGAQQVILSGQGYITREEEDSGIGRRIQLYLLWLDFVIWFLIIFKSVKKHIYNSWPLNYRVFANFSFFTLLISSIFFFDLGFSTRLLQLRFAEFSFFPTAVFLTTCRKCDFENKLTKWAITIGIIQSSYNFIYLLYIAFINPELT